MKKTIYISLLSILCLIMSSCRDELSLDGYRNESQGEGSMELSLMIDDAAIRTRVVDMTPGVGVYIDKIWVGIYDRTSGARVGGTDLINETTLAHRLTETMQKIPNVIPVEWYIEGQQLNNIIGKDLCVVCVANYDNPQEGLTIKTNNGNELKTELLAADTWTKFKNIALDCQSDGFTGGKPLLMGYLFLDTEKKYGKTIADKLTFTKIDQFITGNGVNLYPIGKETIDGTEIDRDNLKFVKAKKNDKGEVVLDADDYLVKLRRLRSRINVNIKTRDDQMTITSMQYAVFNRPKSIFLAQRRTHGFSEAGWGTLFNTSAYSPNSADMVEDGYSSDLNSKNEIVWQIPTNITSFAFDHFENKHWMYNTNYLPKEENYKNENGTINYKEWSYDLYHSREKKNSDGSFKALTSGDKNTEAWNNNASYFILKIGILDKKDGRNATVEYTIHEGFCNDYNGNEISYTGSYGEDYKNNKQYKDWFESRIKDFSCVRNTDYTYNIIINSLEDIEVNVTTGESAHANDQVGDIWEMKYITGKYAGNQIKFKDWDDDFVFIDIKEDKISFAEDPEAEEGYEIVSPNDIAFRLVGEYEGTPVDICYNFQRGELDGFASLWQTPSVYTEYIVKNDNSISAFEALRDYYEKSVLEDNDPSKNGNPFIKMMDNIKLRAEGSLEGMTIYEYIKNMYNEQGIPLSVGKDINGFILRKHNIYKKLSDERLNLRALYIFDREKALLKGHRIGHDGEGIYDDNKFLGWFHTDESSYNGSNACQLYQIYAIEQLPKSIKEEIYEANYATGDPETLIPYTGGEYPDVKFKMDKTPDIALRICGFDDEGKNPFDICYNFNPADGVYSPYSDKWNASKTNYPTIINKGEIVTANIPSNLNTQMQIKVNGQKYDIDKFVQSIENGTIKSTDILTFSIGEYMMAGIVGNPMPYIRGLYVFDKNTIANHTFMDPEYDSATYPMYIAEQLPNYEKDIVKFDASDMIWDVTSYNIFGTNNVSRTSWYGGPQIASVMSWHHKTGINGYKIQIQDPANNNAIKDGTYEVMTLTEADINRFLEYNGDIIHVPFTTTRYNAGNYNVLITAYFDEDIVSNEPMTEPLKLTNALVIQEKANNNYTTWNYTADPWLTLTTAHWVDNKPLKYNGMVFNNTKEAGKGNLPGENSTRKYLQLGGPFDNWRDVNFEFYIHEPTTLIVNVSNTGSGTGASGRHINIYTDESDIPIFSKEIVNSTTGSDLTFTLTPPANPAYNATKNPNVHPYIPSKFYVVPDNNCRIYNMRINRVRIQ